jgi:hypothetical protein
MVSCQPDLSEVFEPDILRYLLRIQMTMVIDDGHLAGNLMVELLCCFGLKQEIAVKKWFHAGIN